MDSYQLELEEWKTAFNEWKAERDALKAERDALQERVDNLKFDMNLVGAQLGITKRDEIEPAVRSLLAAQERLRAQYAAYAELQRLRAVLRDVEQQMKVEIDNTKLPQVEQALKYYWLTLAAALRPTEEKHGE